MLLSRRALTVTLVALLAAVVSLAPFLALAQPAVRESDPPEGASLDQLPEKLHLCFTEPVLHAQTGDFDISIRFPSGAPTAARLVFSPSGDCLDIFPNWGEEQPAGQYQVQWTVTAQSDGSLGSGAVVFSLTNPGFAPAPSPATEPEEEAVPSTQDDGGGPDILRLALITAGAVVGAGALGLILNLLRQRIGYEPHRPPERREEPDEHGPSKPRP